MSNDKFPNLMSVEDRRAYSTERQWLLSETQTLSTMGEAGTGKTHNLKELVLVNPDAMVVTPTHRAANVLRDRIPHADIGTYHSRLIEWIEFDAIHYDEYNIVQSIRRALNTRGDGRGGPLDTIGYRLFSWKPRMRHHKDGSLKSVTFGLWRDLAKLELPIYVDEGSMVGDYQVRKLIKLCNPGQLHFFLDPFQLPPSRRILFGLIFYQAHC